MLYITRGGHVDAERITVKIFPLIERATMTQVNGIVVHQTGGFTNHVGLLQSRCVITKKCTATELQNAQTLEKIRSVSEKAKSVNRAEIKKPFPSRFPDNTDSIGIELVAAAPGRPGHEVFDPVTPEQTKALEWLIKELVETLDVSMHEIYRHPAVGRKNETEAGTATW